ncbi:MAG TPA: PfkB family carbohydrate kinase [Thermoleophilaceae bacterium]|nr:PfkB family carbohydrate kinase [Thermoleophilaceae bacterium]
MRTAVVGHVEWIEFARVERVPVAGEIVHASETWEEPGGGGAVAAVQLAKLAGECTLFTALADEELGHRAQAELEARGVRVEAAFRAERQRRGFVYVDAAGERTITVIGDRLGAHRDDPLDWSLLEGTEAVYATAGDPGAIRAARAARALVGTARDLATLKRAAVELDALVSSGADAGERYQRGSLDPEPRLVIRTAGAAGGHWEAREGTTGSWEATPLPGPVGDAYGAGDSFAAGFTYGLGAGLGVAEALDLGARCGAACMTGRGPYAGQLTAADL